MELNNFIGVQPNILTIAPTHKCTASCKECCFGCTPKIDYIMSSERIIEYIDDSLREYPEIKVIVFTGGECFLMGDELTTVVAHAASYNTITRVVTNGYWAYSYEAAVERLKKLVEANLTEINFSTGDCHQEFVKFDNIVNGILAAYDLGIKTICISVESPPYAEFTSKQIKEHVKLAPIIEEGVLICLDAAWMTFKTEEETRDGQYIYQKQYKPCHNIYNNITINPYSQMLACCGLTVEYNEYLKLGSLEKHGIRELYESQFNDLFKLWLYTDGPEYIYDKVLEERHVRRKSLSHECAYCIELIKDKENIPVIKEIFERDLSNILYRFKMRTAKFICKT